ncbi:MAG: purine-binding chemotaxis protein CheW [Proteobacteria bacterium]|nr:purine-binding chemotaxis protein CheW [Pseudomonadota bacterium]
MTELQDPLSTGPDAAAQARQFLSFRAGDDEFAIDILAIREIQDWTETPIPPNQQDDMLGVLNLRGTIVPIFDLRCRFDLGFTTATRSHVVVIVAIGGHLLGLLVDAVSDILTINAADIRPVPDIDPPIDNAFLAGIIPVGDGMMALLSLENLFANHGPVTTAVAA